MGFQLIKTAFLIRMSPTSGNSLTGNPQAQMILLTIASNRFFSRPLILMERISITKLKEFQVRILAISVTYNALQATEENTLAHNAQISAKRIHHFHRRTLRIGVQIKVGIIGRFRKRIIQNLIKSTTYKLLADDVLQLINMVFLTLNCQGAL